MADAATDGDTVRLAPVLVQPMAADDVADAVARVALGPPVNGIVEVGGPEQLRLDEMVRRSLEAHRDAREVVADPRAPYFGARLQQRTLVPGENAALGVIRYDDWLTRQMTRS
jgi:uncharacterized protein YbjT (DUF2867 family)